MIGEIIGAGASLLGSLFGKKKKEEKTVTESTVDYQKMAANAAAAGFNPLTAIRNGGSAGFTTSTTTSPTASALPGALQNIGGILGDALANQLDPVAKKQRQLDTALVDYQLRQLKEGPKAASGTLYPGSQFFGTKVAKASPTMTGSKKGFIGPPMPEHLKLGVGKAMPMYVTVIDDNGKRHRFPNPDLPDLDQMLTPSVGVVADEASTAVSRVPGGFGEWVYGMRERMERMRPRAVVKPSIRKGGGW